MKKLIFIFISLALVLMLGLSALGCAAGVTPNPGSPSTSPTQNPGSTTGSNTNPAGKGTLEVLVTDAPPQEEVTSILVTVSKVEVHKVAAPVVSPTQSPTASPTQSPTATGTAAAGEQAGEWLTINIPESARTFDLLKVKGIEQSLATTQIEAGKYTQVRITVLEVKVGLGGGEPKPAEVPSGELKFVQGLEVKAGEITSMLFDFDAAQSVNVTGNGKILVKPVIKLTVKEKGKANADDKAKNSQQESRKIAEEFVKHEPTFVFDGIENTLKLVETTTLQTPNTWQFAFEFQSRHAGYGDRTGKVVAEVITPHRAEITVSDGKVIIAIMDGKWDMLQQKEITPSPTQTT